MRLLLDTHLAIWGALDPDALTPADRRLMAEADAPLVLSAVSVLELRLKWHSFHITGARKSPASPAAIVASAIAMNWPLLPLTTRHAAAERAQKSPHKNPS